ncbi:amidase [Streptomyces cyaneus]|uniref:amidase n=1 Tax=Streptomyces cyaneus TaxID=1904 RepID=UPI000FF8AD58|nr:amidase [Streptomyces cyaneus]
MRSGPGYSARSLTGQYAEGALLPSSHVAELLDRITEGTPEGSAFVSVDRDSAMAAARRADLAYRSARVPPPLCGVPVSVKDLLDVAGLPTGRGRAGDAPAAATDSPVVEVVRRAGAVILGKTRTSEDGWSASTVGACGPASVNPRCPDRSSGGSSGGAAVAVATGLGPIAIGTDGAGSVRIPAAWCGVVGFKPTWERWAYGPRGDSLSHVGALAATVTDCLLLDRLAATVTPEPDRTAHPLHRVAWLSLPHASHGQDTLRADLHAVCGRPAATVALDTTGAYSRALVPMLAAGEHPRLARHELWPGHAEVARSGAAVTERQLRRAEEVRARLAADLDAALAEYRVLALPTVAVPAFGRDEEYPPGTDVQGWLGWAENTFLANLTGHPAISLPWGTDADGVPLGLQLIGRRGQDRALLEVAGLLETEAARSHMTRAVRP